MRSSALSLALLAVCAGFTAAAAACSNEPDDGSGGGPLDTRPSAGGSTRDFGGAACAPCAETLKEIAWDDASTAGASADQLIERYARAYTAAAVWRAGCPAVGCAHDAGCRTEPASFADERTDVYLAVTRASAPAVVEGCRAQPAADGSWPPDDAAVSLDVSEGADEQPWFGYLRIPVAITLRTSDGLLDELGAGVISVNPCHGVQLDGTFERSDIAGEIASALPDLGFISWSARFQGEPTIEVIALTAGGTQRLAQLAAASSSGCENPVLESAD